MGLNDIAAAELLCGDDAAAERDFREALKIARAVDFREGIASYTGNLAELALQREDWPGAEALASESLFFAEKIGRLEVIAGDCHRLAIALVRQRKKEEALPYARRAVEIFQKLGSPDLARARQIRTECENSESGSD